ncbi:hypothetical protein DPMN_083624 [Dreissena polymorpha]|uniref:Fibronectin type-III domain-containing protein n=1 Tax=Dreissena polymorpha TaxID=45954 RepID=A0A9D4BHV8_DREPO|nr:hypothetical protein DPMN_083624 [Dreissena polymorpha]
MQAASYIIFVGLMLASLLKGLCGSELSCVINYKSWLVPRDINLRWTIKDLDTDASAPDSFHVIANWTSDGFWGIFQNVTPTSCACAYNPALGDCLDFREPFILHVHVMLKNQTTIFEEQWQIDPIDCEKPPAVGEVNVTVLNNHSVNVSVTWSRQLPIPRATEAKYYFMYRKNGLKDWKEVQNNVSRSTTGISTVVVGLSPFTKYEFTVTCRKLNLTGSLYGHPSDIISVNEARTDEAPPSMAPELCRDCFSIVHSDRRLCNVILYWKDIPIEAKNGLIQQFNLEVSNITSSASTFSSKYSVPGNVFRYHVTLPCRQLYTVNLQAGNSAGWSDESSIDINTSDSPISEVIPEVNRDVNSSLSVSWTGPHLVTDTRHAADSRASVYWCFKDASGECDQSSPIVTVPSTHLSLHLSSDHPIGRYRVGVAYDTGGIVWAKCIYYKPEAVTKLSMALTVTSDGMPSRTLLVQWTTPSCGQVEPVYYISEFVLTYCQRSEQDANCTGLGTSVKLSNTLTSYVLEALNQHNIYLITMQSRDRNGVLRMLASANGSCAPDTPDARVAMWIGVAASVLLTLCVGLIVVKRVRIIIERRLKITLPVQWNEQQALITELHSIDRSGSWGNQERRHRDPSPIPYVVDC